MSLVSATRNTPTLSQTKTTVPQISETVLQALASSLDSTTRNALADLVLLCTEQIDGLVSGFFSLKTGENTINLSFLEGSRICLSITLSDSEVPLVITCEAALFNKHIGDF